MRTKPRLKLTPFYCDNPRCPTPDALQLGYYPSRDSVRRKMSSFRYCSTRCQRQHWEARKREERATAKRSYPCAGPGCSNEIESVYGPGRPPTYCSIECKRNAASSRGRREPGSAVVRAEAAVREAEGLFHAAQAPYREYKEHYDLAIASVKANRKRVDDAVAKLEAFRQRQQERAQAAKDLLAGEEAELNADLRRAKARLAKVEKAPQMVQRPMEEAEEALREPLAALEQARAALAAAEERNAKKAAQARARRARRTEVADIFDALQIDFDQNAKDRDRARSDPEYRAWLRDRGMLKEGW